MVAADADLVTFQRGPLSGSIVAHADADADAKFDMRRGFRLSAEAKASIQAHLDAQFGADPQQRAAAAAVDASIGASTRLALAAQLGVNGLWAEGCAAGEARARIRGDFSVTGGSLLAALTGGAGATPPALVPVEAFLREVGIQAGAYAEAYFAVRARARAMITGSVLPAAEDDDRAAFSVAFDYGYAYIFGAGVSGYLDVDLPDAPRVLGVVVEAALRELLVLLPADLPAEVRAALRTALPLAASAASALGRALGTPRPDASSLDTGRSSAVDGFLGALRTTGLDVVLDAALEAAVKAAIDALNRLFEQIELGDDFVGRVGDVVAQARAVLPRLAAAPSLRDALPAVVELLGPLADLTGPATAPGLATVGEALTAATAVAALLASVLPGAPVAELPAPTAARIRGALGLAAGEPVTPGRLVEFLGTELVKVVPDLRGADAVLTEVLGVSGPDLIGLLWDLGGPAADPAERRRVAQRAITVVTRQAATHVRPLFDNLADDNLKQLGALVQPLLELLDVAVQPLLALAEPIDAAAAACWRDVLDTQLTGTFGALVVRCLDTVVRPFFGAAEKQLTALADRVDRADPAFAEFFRLANEAEVVFRISPAIVAAGLREIAGVLDLAEHSAFDSAVELMTVFTLLPVDDADRRQQLAILAGTNDPRIGSARLRTELLDAMLVRSSEFALGMILPSIRMTTLIALDQGPVSLVTLYQDARVVARAAGDAIEAAASTAGTVADIIGGLLTRGRVTAEDLHRLAGDLRALIGGLGHLVRTVIDLVKDLSWPLFVLSTGGFGLLLRQQFDDFFDGADWLVDEITARLSDVADAFVEAAVAVAQNVGILDSGEDDDLGTLGQAVRQRTLGTADRPDLVLLDGDVQVSQAELATLVANTAFGDGQVRSAVRAFHARAVEQQENARQAALLLAPDLAEAQATEAALSATLAAQQRDTGFQFQLAWPALTEGASLTSGSVLEITVGGASRAFVDGAQPLVRIEIGGRPAPIDPAAWWVDEHGVLRGQFLIVADPYLGAAHPYVADGFVTVGPPAVSAPAGPGPANLLLGALNGVLATQSDDDPAARFRYPADAAPGRPRAGEHAAQFLPPVLGGPGAAKERFPAVLAADLRQIGGLVAGPVPGSLHVVAPPAPILGAPTILLVSAADIGAIRPALAAAPAGTRAPFLVVARARPGCVTVTASVCAVPRDDQDSATTPRGNAMPTWFVLAGPDGAPPPADHDDAEVVAVAGVPDTLATGASVQVSVTMRNIGTTTWTTADGYRLGAQAPAGNTVWGSAWQDLGAPVPPGQTATFTFAIPAPPLPSAYFSWQMLRENAGTREWFGPPTPQRTIARAVNNAVFVGQNVPAAVPRGSVGIATVTMRNAGTTTWSAATAHRLGAMGFDSGVPRHELPGPVAPGQDVTFSFPVSPPGAPSAVQWRMVQEGVEWFGAPSTAVTVKAVEPVACANLRATRAGKTSEIEFLQEELHTAAPKEKSEIISAIKKLNAELTKLEKQSLDLGCDQ